eukprot:gene13811-biopygen12126
MATHWPNTPTRWGSVRHCNGCLDTSAGCRTRPGLVRSCITEPNWATLLGPAGRPAGWPTCWIPNALEYQRVGNALDSQRVANALDSQRVGNALRTQRVGNPTRWESNASEFQCVRNPTRWDSNALDPQRVPNALDFERVGNALRPDALLTRC